jgi:Mg2+-importing ATPase
LLGQLGTTPSGLDAATAEHRLQTFGRNALDRKNHARPLPLLAKQFTNPLVLILVVGAAISLFVREWVDALIILVIIAGSGLLGFFQEYSASKAVDALQSRLALTSKVRRDGLVVPVNVETIVPGDIVLLAAGDLVPADGVLIEANRLLTVEAALTGESLPIEKDIARAAADAALSARSNCMFLGTSVRSGTGTIVVVRTGPSTALGEIAGRLDQAEPKTEFARGLSAFGVMLLKVMIVVAIAVIAVRTLSHRDPIESMMFAMALAVGLSPELLPAIVSVTLAAGAREMARHGVIVRKLESIENLGSIDILCTDKTGTLTEGIIALSGAMNADGKPSPSVLRDAFVNAALQSGMSNPLDDAIAASGRAAGITVSARKLNELPYDFSRKRLTILIEDDDGQTVAISKGAFDQILEVCSDVERAGTSMPLDAGIRDALRTFYADKGAAGFRVLGLAKRTLKEPGTDGLEIEAEMTFVGFLLFFDPPKSDVAKTLRALHRLGIELKIISGDNRFVSAHIAQVVGLPEGELITGDDIRAIAPEELRQRLSKANVFAEIEPDQKEQIIRALQACGHAVGYMGDGINDALALQTADVGISVESAVDVARESASIVLLRRDLDALRHGVVDGRRTFSNTMKYINITISANFGNTLSMAAATLFLPFLPLTAMQILLNNFLSDLPAMAIASDRVDPAQQRHVQHWRIADIRRFMLLFGLVSTVFDLLTFALLLKVFHAGAAVFQTAWFVVSLLTELAVVFVLRTRGPAQRSAPGHLLVAISLGVGAVALALPYTGPVGAIFGFVSLPAAMLASLILIVMAYVGATEAAKLAYYRSSTSSPSRPRRV